MITFITLQSASGISTAEDVRTSISSAFIEVARAEKAGGDVSVLVAKLNSALSLVRAGGAQDLVRAEVLVSEVRQSAAQVESSGAQSTSLMHVLTGVSVAVLGVLALLIWFYGPRVFWGLWARLHRDWVVERA